MPTEPLMPCGRTRFALHSTASLRELGHLYVLALQLRGFSVSLSKFYHEPLGIYP